jgi:hypothetical protein
VKHPNNTDFQMNNQMPKAFTLKLRTNLHCWGIKLILGIGNSFSKFCTIGF